MRTTIAAKRLLYGASASTYFLHGAAAAVARGSSGSFPDGGPLLAGGGGSELPWWSPIAVTLLLFAVAYAYRRWDRARSERGGDADTPGGEHPLIAEETPPASVDEGPTDGGATPRSPRVSRKTPRFPGAVDGRAPVLPG